MTKRTTSKKEFDMLAFINGALEEEDIHESNVVDDEIKDIVSATTDEIVKDIESKEVVEQSIVEEREDIKEEQVIEQLVKEEPTEKKTTDDKTTHDEKIQQAKDKIYNDISEQLKQLKSNNTVLTIDAKEYLSNSPLFETFIGYCIGKMFIPKTISLNKLSSNEYINNTTVFKYNSYDSPNVNLGLDIPTKLLVIESLNNIFSNEFIDVNKGDFQFNDIDTQIAKYLFENKDVGTTVIEYKLIKSLFNKLIINLHTVSELALRESNSSRIGTDFKQCIMRDMKIMKFIQADNGKTYHSWQTFINALLSIDNDATNVYVHSDFNRLNNILNDAYEHDFLLENLFGNMLKCYLPSVAINYFHMVKAMYIVVRLISIYVVKGLFKDKSFDDVVQDFSIIARVGGILYENLAFVYKLMPRTLPRYEHDISENTKMYITNHMLTGGQYYILKMFEKSIPSIVNLIVK